jgi:hypothetical protein
MLGLSCAGRGSDWDTFVSVTTKRNQPNRALVRKRREQEPSGSGKPAWKEYGFVDHCISNVRISAPEAQSWLAPRFSVGKRDSAICYGVPEGRRKDIIYAGTNSPGPFIHSVAMYSAEENPGAEALLARRSIHGPEGPCSSQTNGGRACPAAGLLQIITHPARTIESVANARPK